MSNHALTKWVALRGAGSKDLREVCKHLHGTVSLQIYIFYYYLIKLLQRDKKNKSIKNIFDIIQTWKSLYWDHFITVYTGKYACLQLYQWIKIKLRSFLDQNLDGTCG